MDRETELLKKVDLIISDVDGIWTDGGMYYSSKGDELKKFSVYDGGAVIFLKLAKIPLVILSGEQNEILSSRFEKLKIEDIRLGINNKQLELTNILKMYNVKEENVLFLGDFINDYPIMKSVGIPVCPVNACEEIKELSKVILKKSGGDGVLWDLTKRVLISKNVYHEIFQKYVDQLRFY